MIRAARAEHSTRQCSEIQELKAKHDTFNWYRKGKEASSTYNRQDSILVNNNERTQKKLTE